MEFPKRTVGWAEGIKKQLVLESQDSSEGVSRVDGLINSQKKRMVREMFYGLHYAYGFEESLTTRNWSPWPNECTQVNCYGQSIANYVVAKSSGLEPQLVEYVGFQKEGQTHRAGHSPVVVDVGTGLSEFWVIDQAQSMFGPVSFEKNALVVQNVAAKESRTIRRDYMTRRFGFILNMVSDENRIVRNMNNLQLNAEAVLFPGQRIAIPLIDAWHSEKPLEAPWYIKFVPDDSGVSRGEVVSRVLMDRPGIRSRGLEYRFSLSHSGIIENERVVGYYCNEMVWADFSDPIPLLDMPLEELVPLLEGVRDIPLIERYSFEHELMTQSSRSTSVKSDVNMVFDSLVASEFGEVVYAISAVEALYQHARGSEKMFRSGEGHRRELNRLKQIHPIIGNYVRAINALHAVKKKNELVGARKNRKKGNSWKSFLNPNQVENPRLRAFLSLESELDRIMHIVENKPVFLEDAIDRMLFYEGRIKGRELKVLDIARDTFGSEVDSRVRGGYGRIFAEFLGHFSVAFSQVTLEKYKEGIVERLVREV